MERRKEYHLMLRQELYNELERLDSLIENTKHNSKEETIYGNRRQSVLNCLSNKGKY